MKIINDEIKLHHQLQQWQYQGNTTALVPIMEPLHRGHITLIAKAKQHAKRVIVCICYPKTLTESYLPNALQDQEKLLYSSLADLVYKPEIALSHYQDIRFVSDILNFFGQRSSFKSIATITCKMLSQMCPSVVCLSEKDFQQMMVIRHMIANLTMPIHIISMPTEREPDGLAVSAYNYLLPQELRPHANQLKNTIDWMGNKLKQGNSIKRVITQGKLQLRTWGFQPDYIDILDPYSLKPADEKNNDLGIFASAFLGRPRLNDHLIIQR